MNIKKAINHFRYNRHVSFLLSTIFFPVARFCYSLDRQIKMKVWVNGRMVSYDGYSLSFPPNLGVGYCSNIFWNDVDGFEPKTYCVLKFLIDKHDLFLDIGANIGFYSVMAKLINPSIRVKAFEPVPSIFDSCRTFHKANNIENNELFNVAVGDCEGQVEIYLPISESGIEEETTATVREESWQFEKPHITHKVSSITIDGIMKNIKPGQRILIKIDVEDFEASVLRGATNTLKYLRPSIVCEILPRQHENRETIEILEQHNYVIFGISKECLIRFNPIDFAGPRTFTDFLLLPQEVAPTLNYICINKLELIDLSRS